MYLLFNRCKRRFVALSTYRSIYFHRDFGSPVYGCSVRRGANAGALSESCCDDCAEREEADQFHSSGVGNGTILVLLSASLALLYSPIITSPMAVIMNEALETHGCHIAFDSPELRACCVPCTRYHSMPAQSCSTQSLGTESSKPQNQTHAEPKPQRHGVGAD
jgi:hypothetical protein